MKISIWSKLGLITAAIVLTGQGCTISIGSTARKDGGVFRSDDHGKTWVQKNFVRVEKKRNILLDDVTGRVLVFDPKDSNHLLLGTLANGIWETKNGGDAWTPTSLRAGAYDCLSLDTLNPQVMYTAAGQTVLKSVNGGQAWTAVYTESQPDQTVNCVMVNPVNDREVWATTSGGKVLFSDDYGQRWTLIYTLPAMQPRLLYIPTDKPSQLYVFTRSNGLMRADNRGQTWTDLSKNLPPEPGTRDIRAVQIHPQGWFLATARGLLKSTDSGATWTMIPTLITTGSVPLQNVAVNPKNPLDIFITTNQRLHHTVDGGASWSVITLPTGRLPVLMTFDPTQADRLYMATYKEQKK